MKMIAAHAYSTRAIARFCVNTSAVAMLLTLAGCSVLQAPARPAVYDFGPGALISAVAAETATPRATRPSPLLLTDVETTPALDSASVLFRLSYVDAQQLRQEFRHIANRGQCAWAGWLCRRRIGQRCR